MARNFADIVFMRFSNTTSATIIRTTVSPWLMQSFYDWNDFVPYRLAGMFLSLFFTMYFFINTDSLQSSSHLEMKYQQIPTNIN